jgi:hypothetical protein
VQSSARRREERREEEEGGGGGRRRRGAKILGVLRVRLGQRLHLVLRLLAAEASHQRGGARISLPERDTFKKAGVSSGGSKPMAVHTSHYTALYPIVHHSTAHKYNPKAHHTMYAILTMRGVPDPQQYSPLDIPPHGDRRS